MNPARALRVVLLATLFCSIHASARAQDEDRSAKSPGGALAYSLLGTVVPIGVGVGIGVAASNSSTGDDAAAAAILLPAAGLLFGPSLGHFYAGRSGHAFAGIGLRVAGIAGLAAGTAMDWNHPSGPGAAIGLVGGGLFLGSIICDIASAPRAAREWNRDAATRRISVRPTVVGEARAPGLRVDVRL